jgi:hypothetical protein
MQRRDRRKLSNPNRIDLDEDLLMKKLLSILGRRDDLDIGNDEEGSHEACFRRLPGGNI